MNQTDLVCPSGLSSFDFAERQPQAAKRPQLFIRVLTLYVEQSQSFIDELTELSINFDLKKAELLLHSLKGTSGSIGMWPLYDIINAFEKKLAVQQKFEQADITTLNEWLVQSYSDAKKLIEVNSPD